MLFSILFFYPISVLSYPVLSYPILSYPILSYQSSLDGQQMALLLFTEHVAANHHFRLNSEFLSDLHFK